MTRDRKLNRLIFILALIFMGFRVNFIGSISLTEIFVLFQVPFLIKWVINSSLPYLKALCWLFVALILAQTLSEYIVQNTFVNAIRGIAITIMALLLFLFFLRFLCRDISLIKWIPVGLLVQLILWGDQFGYAETGEDTYFKFYVAPFVTYVVCFLSMSRINLFRRNILWIFLFASIFIITGGARSSGFSLLFCTLFCVIYNRYKSIRIKRILPGLLLIAILFQLFYAHVYVPKVASGEWGTPQNRMQLARVNNSTNVLMMLFSARSDFYISYLAFLDKPLWGYGAWKKDKDLKYARLEAKLFSERRAQINKKEVHWIPAHSVIMGMGSKNGVFAFILILCIFYMIYRVAIKALWADSPYNLYLIYTIVGSFLHMLFGPSAILKNYGSLAFALFFALYYWKAFNLKQKNEVQITRSYSNLQT